MTVIQIRDVPTVTADRLKERARREGRSLSDYLRGELERLASQPTLGEVLERLASREPVGGRSAAAILRAERDRRG